MSDENDPQSNVSEVSNVLEQSDVLEQSHQTNDDAKVTINKSTFNNLLKGIVVAIAITAFFGGYFVGTFDNTDSGVSNEEIKEILTAIQKAPVPQPTQQPSQPNAPQIFQISLDDDPFKGDPNAPVIVVEFSDFQCPFCSRFYQQTLPLIQENYIDTGKIKFVYRDLPLDSLHPNARLTHIAAECADEQEKFWEYHDVLFDKQSQWQRLSSTDLPITLTQYAADLGIQTESFETCLESEEMANEVKKDVSDAARYGSTGTPTFFVGNEEDGFIKLVGAQPYAAFQAAIENYLS